MDSMRKNSERFYGNCTPGYFNNEGKLSSNSFYGGLYGGGTIKFFDIVRDWRARDDLRGMTLNGVQMETRKHQTSA